MSSIWGGRPKFRSKRGQRCSLETGHVTMLHCKSCGITHPFIEKFYNGGICKRCGKDWVVRIY